MAPTVERRDRCAARQRLGDDQPERLLPRRCHDGDRRAADCVGQRQRRRLTGIHGVGAESGRDLAVEVRGVVDRAEQR